jgi:hypothetical protein
VAEVEEEAVDAPVFAVLFPTCHARSVIHSSARRDDPPVALVRVALPLPLVAVLSAVVAALDAPAVPGALSSLAARNVSVHSMLTVSKIAIPASTGPEEP